MYYFSQFKYISSSQERRCADAEKDVQLNLTVGTDYLCGFQKVGYQM